MTDVLDILEEIQMIFFDIQDDLKLGLNFRKLLVYSQASVIKLSE